MSLLRFRRAIFSLVMIAFVSGCTGAELATLPGDLSDASRVPESPAQLEIGDNARVHLRSGESVTGEVIALNTESVTLARVGNSGYEEHEIEAGDLLSIERTTSGNVWTVAAVVGVGLLALLAISISGWELN